MLFQTVRYSVLRVLASKGQAIITSSPLHPYPLLKVVLNVRYVLGLLMPWRNHALTETIRA